MALVINTNVASLSAQNSMNKAQMEQNTAMERLTTGKRINTAADDAAGMAIANRMTSQVNGLNQAVRNANDGISMIQTAAGGLEESSNILQRMRELAVQSASGTYDEGNRGSMNAEVEQLKAELDRISETTTFNGQKILDGSKQDVSLQVGADANETIDFSIDSINSRKLGGNTADIVGGRGNLETKSLLEEFSGAIDGDPAGTAMYINGKNVGDLTGLGAESQNDLLAVLNDKVDGVEIGALASYNSSSVGSGILTGDQGLEIRVTGGDVLQGDITTQQEVIRIQNTSSMEDLVDKINEKANGLVTASIADNGTLSIIAEGATSLTVTASDDMTAAAPGHGATAGNAVGIGAATTTYAQLTMTAEPGTEDITVTYADPSVVQNTGVNIQRATGELVGYADSSGNTGGTTIAEGAITVNGVELGEYDATIDYSPNDSTPGTEADFLTWFNSYSDQTGVTASLDDTDDPGSTYVLKLTSLNGEPISLDYDDAMIPGDRDTLEAQLGLMETNATKGSTGSVDGIDISTAAGAQKAIGILDKAIEQVSEIQGELGAVENRLDFTVSNLSNVSENAAAARSRIEDADFATESANLSRAQVLQQASQAMLAQANAAPKQVMSLLQ